MRHRLIPAAALVLAAGFLGCKVSKDSSKVLAQVGDEKITEQTLETTVKALVPQEQVDQILKGKGGEKAQVLATLVQGKSLLKLAKLEGLDKDPKAKLIVEQAVAQAYAQVLMERRMGKVEPREEDLKVFYDEKVAELKAMGRAEGIPPYEQVKAQLSGMWKKAQQEKVQVQFLKELETKVPVTYAEGMRPGVR